MPTLPRVLTGSLAALALALGACSAPTQAEQRVSISNGRVTPVGAASGKAILMGSVKAPRAVAAFRLQAVRSDAAANAKVVVYDDGGSKLGEGSTSGQTGAFRIEGIPVNEPLRVVATLPEGSLVAFGRAFEGAPELEVGPGSTAVCAWVLGRTKGKVISLERSALLAASADVEKGLDTAEFLAAWGDPTRLAALVDARRLSNPLLITLMGSIDASLAREGFAPKADAQASADASGAKVDPAASI